ncbi:MAG: hypothetical protein JWQ43_1647 [Glaciihabitans sp.]|nr:hypothetical protein [Glaciihabitans sp.]
MTTTHPASPTPSAPRRLTGLLFLLGTLAFGTAASILSATFDWPDILREDAAVVLPAFTAGGSTLAWTWFATAWAYSILLVPILLLPRVLGRSGNPALHVATIVGAGSVVFSLIGFLRWFFVVPALARAYETGDAATRAATEAAWLAQHQFGGALLGEHLGQLGAIAWSATLAVIILRTGALPRWLGWTGLASSFIYLLNQGDVVATAIPDFPVLDIAGLLGSTSWGLWIAALGITLILRRVRQPDQRAAVGTNTDIGTTRVPSPAGARS